MSAERLNIWGFDGCATDRSGKHLCTACCELLKVKDDHWVSPKGKIGFEKPAESRCAFQQYGQGCKVQRQKPDQCRPYHCSQTLTEAGPNGLVHLRPSRANIVLRLIDTAQRNGEVTSSQATQAVQRLVSLTK